MGLQFDNINDIILNKLAGSAKGRIEHTLSSLKSWIAMLAVAGGLGSQVEDNG